jgi:hypothetical protein
VRFLTPILHCNVNSHGKICHSILDRNYSADTSVKMILDCVYGLLLTPDKHDPIDSTLALSANNDSGEYEGSIMAHVQLHASRSREELIAELEGTEVAFTTGARVTLHGMISPQGRLLNGRTAEVESDCCDSDGFYLVRMDRTAGVEEDDTSSTTVAPDCQKRVKAAFLRLRPTFALDMPEQPTAATPEGDLDEEAEPEFLDVVSEAAAFAYVFESSRFHLRR